MKRTKLLRATLFITLYTLIISALSVILYKVNLPFLSPDAILNPTIIVVIAVALTQTKKVKNYINAAK